MGTGVQKIHDDSLGNEGEIFHTVIKIGTSRYVLRTLIIMFFEIRNQPNSIDKWCQNVGNLCVNVSKCIKMYQNDQITVKYYQIRIYIET